MSILNESDSLLEEIYAIDQKMEDLKADYEHKLRLLTDDRLELIEERRAVDE